MVNRNRKKKKKNEQERHDDSTRSISQFLCEFTKNFIFDQHEDETNKTLNTLYCVVVNEHTKFKSKY